MYSSNLESYFKSVGRQKKLLTRAQEVELAKKIEAGDQRARAIMIESNLKLAISIAKKYSKYGSDLEDLIQEANIGLMKAVEKFDWRRGYKFSTYACWWIKQAVTRYLTGDNTLLKVPSHTLANARKLNKVIREYEEEFDHEPTKEEIADIMGLPVKHVEQAIEASKTRYIKSIDMPVSSDGEGRTLGEMLPDHDHVSIETKLDNQKIRASIVEALKSLSKREELVLRLRFGISELNESDENIYTVKL